MADETSTPQRPASAAPAPAAREARPYTPRPLRRSWRRRVPRVPQAVLAARRSGRRPGGRKFFRRKKVCKFCTEKIDAITLPRCAPAAGLCCRARQDRSAPPDRRLHPAPAPRQRWPSSSRATSRCWPSPRASNFYAPRPVLDRSWRTGQTGNSENSNGSHSEGRRQSSSAIAAMWSRSRTATGATICCPAKLAIEATPANKAVDRADEGLGRPQVGQGEGRVPRSCPKQLERSNWCSSAKWARTTTSSVRSPRATSRTSSRRRASRSTGARSALEEPLKSLGEFHVPIKLHREVTSHLKVTVKGEEPAAEETTNRSLTLRQESKSAFLAISRGMRSLTSGRRSMDERVHAFPRYANSCTLNRGTPDAGYRKT